MSSDPAPDPAPDPNFPQPATPVGTPAASDVATSPIARPALPGSVLAEPVSTEPVPPGPVVHPGAVAGRARRSNAVVIAVAVIAVLAGSALFASGWSLGRQAALTPGTPASEADMFQPFWDTYRAITERYAGGDVDRKSLVEGAIKGMIAALDDQYSQYLTSEEFKASLQDLSGQFEGIGATIGTVDANGKIVSCATVGPNCRLVVVQPIKGSPAEQAGLETGDVITMIDGTRIDGLTVDDARGKLRGPKDTTVRITIVRGKDLPFILPIVRAVIVMPEVETRTLAGGTVGYIKLSGFSDHGAVEFDAAVHDAVAAGDRSLIFDLRGNRGGFVTAAREIASQFISDGTIFWEQDAQGTLTQTLAMPGGAATDPSIRLVVLVDGDSASASEIVAAALHDNGRATLVGTKTFGKGTVQQWTQLEGDFGGFRLTIARWLTPRKVWINRAGIQPDVVVTATPQRPGDDPALAAALGVLGAAPTDGSSTGQRLRAGA